MLFWIAAARVHSYWTNWQMTLEYLEERPHLQSEHSMGNLQVIQQQ